MVVDVAFTVDDVETDDVDVVDDVARSAGRAGCVPQQTQPETRTNNVNAARKRMVNTAAPLFKYLPRLHVPEVQV